MQRGDKSIEIYVQGDIRSVAFLRDEKHIITSGHGLRELHIWDIKDGKQVETMAVTRNGWVIDIIKSGDKSWVVSRTSQEGGMLTVQAAESPGQRVVGTVKELPNDVYAVDVSPDRTKIVIGSYHRTAVVWSLPSGNRLLTLPSDYPVFATKFSPNGRLFITAAWRYESIQIHDTDDGRLLADFKIQVTASFNRSIAWHHDSKQLFILSHDGHIHHLDVPTGSTLSKWRIHSDDRPRCILLANNLAYIAASANSSVSFWDTTTYEQIGYYLLEHTQTVESMAVSTRHHMVIIAGGTMALRDLRDSLPARYWSGSRKAVGEFHYNLRLVRLRSLYERRLLQLRITTLTTQLEHWKQLVATKTEMIAVLRRRIDRYPDISHEFIFARMNLRTTASQVRAIHDRYNDQLQVMQSALGDDPLQSSDAQQFVADSDVDAEEIIIEIMKKLNTDIWLSAVLMAKYFVRKFQSSDAGEQESAALRASNLIGVVLVHRLERTSREILALDLQIAFRAHLNSHLCRIISSWTIDTELDELISQMYKRVQESESQMFAAHWRSLTRTHVPPTDPETLVSIIVQGLADIVVAAGCAPSISAANEKLSLSFRYRISSLIGTAERLRRSVGNVIAADFKVVAIGPSRIFDSATMEVEYFDGRTRPSGVGRAQKILCTTRLGLIKEIVTEPPDPGQKNSKTVSAVIKAKVLLESSLPIY